MLDSTLSRNSTVPLWSEPLPRRTGALLDRLSHHVQILEMNARALERLHSGDKSQRIVIVGTDIQLAVTDKDGTAAAGSIAVLVSTEWL